MTAPSIELGDGVTAEIFGCDHGDRTHAKISIDVPGEQGERTISWCAQCDDRLPDPSNLETRGFDRLLRAISLGRWTCV